MNGRAVTHVIDSLRDYLNRPRTAGERAIDGLLFGLFLVGVAYLLFKTWQVSEHAEYDFKYIWVAGEAWLRGINPYGPEYHELGKQFVTHHHVPVMWVYPPNWFLPSIITTIVDIDTSSFLTNIVNVALLVASSALLVAACPPVGFENAPRNAFFDFLLRHLGVRWNVFFLHVWAMAVLETTALVISVGQTSILVYFGACLLIYGLARERGLAAVLGLTIVFLKPQIAVVVFVALMMDRAHRTLVAKAIGMSLLISLPAFVITPAAAYDFFVNLTRYDAISSANWPQSTTGLRHLIWDVSGYDPGNIAAMLAAIAVMAGLYLAIARGGRKIGHIELMSLASAVTVAIAPLHIYDMVLVGVMLFTLMQSRPLNMVIGGLGAALLWRADNLGKLTGFYGAGTQHFEGTRLATFGALLMLIAVFLTVRRRAAEAAS